MQLWQVCRDAPEFATERTITMVNGYLEEFLLAECTNLENGIEESCTVGDYCKRIYGGGTPSTKISSYLERNAAMAFVWRNQSQIHY